MSVEWIDQLSRWLQDVAVQYGYLGVFAVSFIGATSVIFPIPYTLVIFYLGTLRLFDPILIGISGGAGSALGEFFGYLIGYYGRAALSEERRRKLSYVVRAFSRYGAFTIFVFALTPLPDDLLFIPLGMMKYPFIKAFIPSLAGKTLMCLILAYGGHLSIGLIRRFIGEEAGYAGIIISTILLVALLIILVKVDWEKLLPTKDEEGSHPSHADAHQHNP